MAAPKVNEIYEEIKRKVQDDSYTLPIILGMMNEGLAQITSEYLLPALDATSAVTTTSAASYVSLPSDFHRNLYECYSETNEAFVDIYPDKKTLLNKHEGEIDDNGDVDGVAIWGNNLYYQLVPTSAETLRLFYSKNFTELEAGSRPICLPDHLAKRLLVNYVCAEIFDEIEDGIDGKKLNTERYTAKLNQSLAELGAHIHSLTAKTYSTSSGWI